MISPTFNAILKVLGHLHCNFGLARLLSQKKFNNSSNGWFGSLKESSRFSDHYGTKLFKITQKLTELRHLKNYLNNYDHFPIEYWL